MNSEDLDFNSIPCEIHLRQQQTECYSIFIDSLQSGEYQQIDGNGKYAGSHYLPIETGNCQTEEWSLLGIAQSLFELTDADDDTMLLELSTVTGITLKLTKEVLKMSEANISFDEIASFLDERMFD